MSLTTLYGVKVLWRFKVKAPCPWLQGWPLPISVDMVRMGAFNGDHSGPIVSIDEIEWRKAT